MADPRLERSGGGEWYARQPQRKLQLYVAQGTIHTECCEPLVAVVAIFYNHITVHFILVFGSDSNSIGLPFIVAFFLRNNLVSKGF